MEVVMSLNKVTNGAIRYSDGESHNLYLRKEEAEKIGNPQHILVIIQPLEKKD